MSDDCMNCGTRLNAFDEDPNGDMGCVCIRCRREEEHDFDIEPTAKFNRRGQRVDSGVN